MPKCFCGNDAIYQVKIKEGNDYKFLDHPRCEDCKKRAENSFKEIEVERIKK